MSHVIGVLDCVLVQVSKRVVGYLEQRGSMLVRACDFN